MNGKLQFLRTPGRVWLRWLGGLLVVQAIVLPASGSGKATTIGQVTGGTHAIDAPVGDGPQQGRIGLEIVRQMGGSAIAVDVVPPYSW